MNLLQIHVHTYLGFMICSKNRDNLVNVMKKTHGSVWTYTLTMTPVWQLRVYQKCTLNT